MTDRYERIRAALEMGPTPGPWEVADGNRYLGIKANSAPIAALHVRVGVAKMHANAHHIAACDPYTIRELLAERDKLAAALAEAQHGLRYAVRVWVLSDEIKWSEEEIDEAVERIIGDAKNEARND